MRRFKASALDTGIPEELLNFIFFGSPQPFDPSVFAQDVTGVLREAERAKPQAESSRTGRTRSAGWDGGLMGSIRKLMLGAAVLAGAAAVSAVPAKATVVGVYVGAPVAYVPPCPGPGYVWVAPYRIGGNWYPGRWNFAGVRRPIIVDRFDRGRVYDRGFYGHDRFRR